MERSGRMWVSGEQARNFERLVSDHPRQEGEGFVSYVERLAILGGALKERLILGPCVDPRGVEQVRLPYRERDPGEDD